MNGFESFTCETGEHSWGGFPDAQGVGACFGCEVKGTERREYVGKAAAPQRPAKPRQAPPAPKAETSPQGGSECPLCGFQFTRPQPKCSNKAACEKRQRARQPHLTSGTFREVPASTPLPLDRLMADIAATDTTPRALPPHRRHTGARWELEFDSLADRLCGNPAVKAEPRWRARVQGLPETVGATFHDRLIAVIERAIQIAEGRRAS